MGCIARLNDVAAQLAAILGKPVSVQQGPIEAMAGALMGFGFTPDQAGLLRDMTAAANNGSLIYETAIQRHGTTTLEESLRRILS